MADMDQLYTALRNADAAGDVDAARRLAAHIKTVQAQPQITTPAPPPAAPHDKGVARSALEGAAMGVSDIGNTALNALAYLPGKISPNVAQWNRTRNADFDALTQENKDSTAFKVGRVGGNVAATLPVGGAIAQTLARVPALAAAAPALLNAVRSGGFVTGSPAATTLAGKAADLAVRSAGGAITGGASAALTDPENAGIGAMVGGALPGYIKGMGVVGGAIESGARSVAERLMQSAIKPTIKQLQTGDAATAVKTLLDYGISPTMAGVEQLRNLIGGLNSQIADKIANSTATIDKAAVINRLSDVKKMFGSQVSPTADLGAIQNVADDFMAHPIYPGSDLTVQAAQLLKQGTYKTLAKKYGQMGGAETEAQKGLARGLKEEIASAVPDVESLNATESSLITTLNVAERRALMELNKNPMGLASLASSPAAWGAFMADRSAVFKALAARMVNGSGGMMGGTAPALESRLSNPLLRTAVQNSVASGER